MITGIEHVGLSVTDMERSLAFYRDILGFEVLRVQDRGPDGNLGKLVGMPGCRARVAQIRLGEAILELFEYKEPRGNVAIARARRQADYGWVHVAVISTDVIRDHVRLRSAGVEFLSEPVEVRPGAWVVFFKGPDGEAIELRQTP